MKKLFLTALGLISAASAIQADNYSINVRLTDKDNGNTAYLVNFDTNERVDSAKVENGIAVFKGETSNPYLANVIINRRARATVIVEPGNIEFDRGTTTGGELNNRMTDIRKSQMEVTAELRNMPDSLKKMHREEFRQRLETFNDKAMNENFDNPIGYVLLMQKLDRINADELNAIIASHPNLIEYKRIASKKVILDKIAETSAGRKFKDFEVEYDGKTYRLSDYVGKGKYVLVDFWASWCGPCIRQTAVIKEILKEHGPKGLEVVGVAVWDKPEDTLEGIKSHNLPWPNIINAQSIPTEIYGITGIPCIILFGPDGTILSRDKQGDALKADVAAAMNQAK